MLYTLRRPVTNFERAVRKEFNDKIQSRSNCNFPKTDVVENGDILNVFLEMPGVGKENISLNLNEDKILTVKGERNEQDIYEGKTIHKRERKACNYIRHIALPDDVDGDKIKAKYNNGLLEIEIPKLEPKAPKEIEISIN